MIGRLQRTRAKGWRMPPGARYVGRGSRFGNRHRITPTCDAVLAVTRYEADIAAMPDAERRAYFAPLLEPGVTAVACWCALTAPCHRDVIARWLNHYGAASRATEAVVVT